MMTNENKIVRTKARVTQELIERFRELYREGVTTTVMAQQLGVVTSTISVWSERYAEPEDRRIRVKAVRAGVGDRMRATRDTADFIDNEQQKGTPK